METIIKQIKMSSTDLTPSRIGFGAMGLTAFYSSTNPVSEEDGITLIGEAIN